MAVSMFHTQHLSQSWSSPSYLEQVGSFRRWIEGLRSRRLTAMFGHLRSPSVTYVDRALYSVLTVNISDGNVKARLADAFPKETGSEVLLEGESYL